MTLWLLIIGFLVALWFVMAPRTGKTRDALALRVPFLPTGTTQREKFKLAVNDALNTRGEVLGIPKDLGSWVNELNNKQLDKLLHQVAEGCSRANVQLNWLLENRAHGESERTLQDTVLLSTWAVYRAHELEAFARLDAYRQNPNARGNRKFGQQLFAKLVEQQNIAVPANLMLAPEKERRAFAHRAIEQAAQENQDALIAIVRDTLNGKNGKAKNAAAESETKALPSSTANVST